MHRRHWATILGIWAAGLGVLVAVFFLGGTVAPCLGITPDTRSGCVAAWEAQRPWTDRFFETPVPTVVLLTAMIAATLLVAWRVRRRAAGSLNTTPHDEANA